MIQAGDAKISTAISQLIYELNVAGLAQRALGRDVLLPEEITFEMEIAFLDDAAIVVSVQANTNGESIDTTVVGASTDTQSTPQLVDVSVTASEGTETTTTNQTESGENSQASNSTQTFTLL